jgi:glycosidase
MELHASREARLRFRLEDFHFSSTGTLLVPDFEAARTLARRMNEGRGAGLPGPPPVKGWQLHAMGLINEIFHYLVGLYRESRKPSSTREALSWLQEGMGRERVEKTLERLVEDFPPPGVREREDAAAFLGGEAPGISRQELELQEALILWLANLNPAYAPGLPLFDDAVLERETAYPVVMEGLRRFFESQPPFGPDDQNLVDMLRSPALAHPDSLYGQLDYIWKRWGHLLGRFRHLHRLLSALDWIREEETRRGGVGRGRPTSPVPEFSGMSAEAEQFSPDREWMPRLVLLARNTHVWLEQLSRKHGRWIQRLDQIPDEDLDLLRQRGFSGLWLIGLWERSAASADIKRIRGNLEAASSAYSLQEYTVASDLGGDAALKELKARAWARGIRLASDMVPNHMGIDSRWVVEHPDWFLYRDRSPYPAYTFNGPDLSRDSRVGVFIEDHYYNETDAAVVFRRLDRWTGSERFVYHGNDGTRTPWNDTAQLNYLNPEVREAVIREILRVARQFPVIRFDAAMTLAKRHYQRLWFPEPGTGGAIPSRAEYGLTRAQFDALMPREFWRDVVDRVAAEAPDTLLLAEAFWLMEGYFVRTLGMHRVYNSAFMNMLRDEDNAKYRSVIKNTLEFDPEVLRRYVNFMNNPDEDPAAEAFGAGDKYFGICTLMATLPGLPMFGHGQWEGLREKYGMEFRKPRWDEKVNWDLVTRHDREISPLLHRRALFAGVENFLLYDFFTPEGHVDENVFAFSNGIEDRRAFVIYQNRFASTRGWIRTSAAFAVKREGGGAPARVQRTLGEGLALTPEEGRFILFRELSTGLEHIRSSRDLCEAGFYTELNAYQCRVFLDVREVRDGEDRGYARLAEELGGRGVPSLENALREVRFRGAHAAFRDLASPEMLRRILAARVAPPQAAPDPAVPEEIEGKLRALFSAVRQGAGAGGDEATVAAEMRRLAETILGLPAIEGRLPGPLSQEGRSAIREVLSGLESQPSRWGLLLGWILAEGIERMRIGGKAPRVGKAGIEEWGMEAILGEALRGLGRDEAGADRDLATIGFLANHPRWWEGGRAAEDDPGRLLRALAEDERVRRILGFNRYRETLYLRKEPLEELLADLLAVAAVHLAAAGADAGREEGDFARRLAACDEAVRALREAAERAGYRVEQMLEITVPPPEEGSSPSGPTDP